VLEVVVAPLRGGGGPGDFQAAGDRVGPLAGAEAVLPAHAHFIEAGRFGIGPAIGRRAGAVRLAERVAPRDERYRLLIVHRRRLDRLADVPGGGNRIGFAVGTFRVDVDQPHLHGGKRIFEVAVARVALVGEPGRLGPPVDVLIRFPDIFAPAAETERLE